MKPASVKWINGLIFLILFASLLFIALGASTLLIHPETGFFKGVEDTLLQRGIMTDVNTAENLGRLIGITLIPVLLNVGLYFSLRGRKQLLFYVLLTLSILASFGQRSLPLIHLIILILSFLKPTRDYFLVPRIEPST